MGIAKGATERAAERKVNGVIAAGVNCDYQVSTSDGRVQLIHLDLCPVVPGGSSVTLTYDRGQVSSLEIQGATINVRDDQASLDYTAGGVRVVLGLGILLLWVPFALGRSLPRLTTRATVFVVATVSIATAGGVIAAMDPLHESTLAEIIGGITGSCIGLLLAAGGVAAHRLVRSRRSRLNAAD
jgi:hypothetical protein